MKLEPVLRRQLKKLSVDKTFAILWYQLLERVHQTPHGQLVKVPRFHARALAQKGLLSWETSQGIFLHCSVVSILREIPWEASKIPTFPKSKPKGKKKDK